jgi:hypothetical protein
MLRDWLEARYVRAGGGVYQVLLTLERLHAPALDAPVQTIWPPETEAAARAAGWRPVTLSAHQVALLAQDLREWKTMIDASIESPVDRGVHWGLKHCIDTLKWIIGRDVIRDWIARAPTKK